MPQLIPNAKQAHRMYVVQILLVIAAVQAIWAELPPEMIAGLPVNLVHYVTAGLALAGIVARVLKQFTTAPPDFQATQPTEEKP